LHVPPPLNYNLAPCINRNLS